MQIGFDGKRYFWNHRGLGNYSRTLVNNLCDLAPENDYHLYAANGNKQYPPPSNLNIHYARQKMIPNAYWRSLSISRALAKDGIEIYHGLSNELPFNIHQFDFKSVVTIHDLLFLRFPENYSLINRKIYERKVRFACEKAHRIIAISQQTKVDLIDYLQVEEAKISIIHQSCHPIYYQGDKAIKEKLSYTLPKDYVLYVGAINPAKNVLALVQAIHHSKGRIPLVLVGRGGSYLEEIKSYIHRHQLGVQITILEEVINEELPAIYQQAKLFVFPSHFEGFGIPIIEAMCSNVPVITTDKPCFRDAGGNAALYVENSEESLRHAITEVLGNEALQQTMISKGEEHVKRFARDKVTSDLLGLYESLV